MSREAMQQALGVLRELSFTDSKITSAKEALRVALAEPENQSQSQADNKVNPAEPEQEPISLNNGRLTQYPDGSIGLGKPTHKPQTTHWEGCEVVHPECRAIQRRPLTHEEIEALDSLPVCPSDAEVITFVRKIERAHGIGEQHE